MSPHIVTADDINRVLRYDTLIDALAQAFRADMTAPEKIAHFIPQPSGRDAKVLLMPAWTTSGQRFIGHKLINVFPDNTKNAKPAVLGSYVLMSGDTGETLAVMDGAALTAWRTAATSALAARYSLARMHRISAWSVPAFWRRISFARTARSGRSPG